VCMGASLTEGDVDTTNDPFEQIVVDGLAKSVSDCTSLVVPMT
jgi:hypothetical protein